VGPALSGARAPAAADVAPGPTTPGLTRAPALANEAELDGLAVFDPQAIDEIRALDDGGGLLPRMVALFAADGERLLGELEVAVREHNLEALVFTSHTLATASVQVGARRLSSLARSTENEARQSQRLCPPARVLRLRAEFAAAQREIIVAGLLPEQAIVGAPKEGAPT
jgi:HPt (histidine-containing phosphotransfer) domain-containing protein